MRYSTNYTKDLQPFQVREFINKTLQLDVVAMARNENGIINMAVDVGRNVPEVFRAFDYFIESPSADKQKLVNLSKKWQDYMLKIFGTEYKKGLPKKEVQREL